MAKWRDWRRWTAAPCAALLAAAMLSVTAAPASAAPAASAADPPGDTVATSKRDAVLPKNWRKSGDLAWTLSGDASALHVLVAAQRTGYTWRTAASLTEPGFDTDEWIGNACVTGSGRRLVVVYAPRTFTNRADLFDRGGFTAVVDLTSGAVNKLPVQSSLASFNPGCGAGETAVVSQFGGERVDDPAAKELTSRIITVDAAEGRLGPPILLHTEVSSPVPVGKRIIAAGSGRLVEVRPDGRLRGLAASDGVPFRLVADGAGRVAFMDRTGGTARIKRASASGTATPRILAEGNLGEVSLTRAANGRVYVVGKPSRTAGLPSGYTALRSVPANAEVSTSADLALTRVHLDGVTDPRTDPDPQAGPRAVGIEARVSSTGAAFRFVVAPDAVGAHAKEGALPHPKLSVPAGARPGRAAAGSAGDPVEGTDERYCSVPRNDPRNQAMQPKPRQIEWAVDQAVTDSLHLTREANWKNLGMPAYSPQGLFPNHALLGGGRVPAQVMLGVIAQESNMWMAPRFILPGVTGNPLIGNFYGRDVYNDTSTDDWDINWADADCGYGATQVTDHMRLAGHEKDENDTAWDYQTQRAVALDFATNVAAGLQILEDKWNEVAAAGLKVHDGSPSEIENWFLAVWAYNSGFHPKAGDSEPWGVGWGNNPINPRFDPDRHPFLTSYDDARTPQYWPYPEKIMGWATHPPTLNESATTTVAGYRAAWFPLDSDAPLIKPPLELFCDQSDQCTPGAKITPNDPEVSSEPAGPCGHQNAAGRYDLRCWYHQSVAWHGPAGQHCDHCAHEVLRFDPGYAYQDDGTTYPPVCGTGTVPARAEVVDDVPAGTPSIRPNCSPAASQGSFRLNFAADAQGRYPSKIDFHQVGGGFGGHMWRASTRTADAYGGKLKVSGTWTSNHAWRGSTRVWVSVPDHGAWTRQAKYTIALGNGQTRFRVVNQAWRQHKWIDLGVFDLDGTPSVTLTTDTADGTGDDSVIFDAVAFAPDATPDVRYVAMGDSYASGEGNQPYDLDSDYTHTADSGDEKDACHRSAKAYPRGVSLPGHSRPIADEAEDPEALADTAQFAFTACSGATTVSVTGAAVSHNPEDAAGHTVWGAVDYHYGEVPQVDQGWPDQDTSLVTLSIGGNDARFSDVMFGCIASLSACDDDSYRLTRRSNGVVDPEPLWAYEKKVISDLLPTHLRTTYAAIHATAPHAQILVVGYPQLFPPIPLADATTCDNLTQSKQKFLNVLGARLNATIAAAVWDVRAEGVNIRYVDPTSLWELGVGADAHWACPHATGSWINAVTGTSSSGSGDDTPGTGSFHPTPAGQVGLARVVNAALGRKSEPDWIRDRILAYAASRGTAPWSGVTPAAALAVADQCLATTARGGIGGDPCMTEPIMVTTAADALGAAQNDQAAISGNPVWVLSRYVSRSEKSKAVSTGWIDTPVSRQTICPKKRPDGKQCDEYPFFSSEQGGTWDDFYGQDSPQSTRLSLIDATENGKEGQKVGDMYKQCGMQGGTYDGTTLTRNGDEYLTVPLLGTDLPGTFYIC